MNHQTTLKNYLTLLVSLVDNLSDADLKKIDSEDYEFSLKVVKKSIKKNEPKEKRIIDGSTLDLIIGELALAETRESGVTIIESHLKGKPELELLAKHVEVAVMANDKISKIKDAIVDSTVGARLRSGAIQGKKI
jgi:hypothetical protein